MNNTATNTATCPTVRKQIGKTTYIVRVHFSETAKETMEDKIKRLTVGQVAVLVAVLFIQNPPVNEKCPVTVHHRPCPFQPDRKRDDGGQNQASAP